MKRRLFISTGYYSTLIASVIASSKYYLNSDDYLLVTIDRQSTWSNSLWANRLHQWKKVDCINHEEFYVEKINFTYDINNFDEVYSPFPEMHLVVSSAFPAKDYIFYEEGLTSYFQFLNQKLSFESKFYCVHPSIFNQTEGLLSLPVSVRDILGKLQSLGRCYNVPALVGNNNVIVIGHGGFPDENKNQLLKDEYFKVIKYYSQQGLNVVLLGHTRFPVGENLLTALTGSNEINFQYIENDCPISDLFLLKNSKKIKVISGVYSTLLVNAQVLFGLKTVTFNSETLSERQSALKKIQSQLLTSQD